MEQVRSPHASRRDRQAALRLMAELRRAATPTGLLPERVDARTGIPRSTTPLAWSHAFAILALRQLWPGARQRNSWKRR
jgi:GH15 family glucan-1,4-alpha-glucosidase